MEPPDIPHKLLDFLLLLRHHPQQHPPLLLHLGFLLLIFFGDSSDLSFEGSVVAIVVAVAVAVASVLAMGRRQRRFLDGTCARRRWRWLLLLLGS